MGIIPKDRGENEKYLKPPPRQVVNNPCLQTIYIGHLEQPDP